MTVTCNVSDPLSPTVSSCSRLRDLNNPPGVGVEIERGTAVVLFFF